MHPGAPPLTPPIESALPEVHASRRSTADPLRPLQSAFHGRSTGEVTKEAIPLQAHPKGKYQVERDEETALPCVLLPEGALVRRELP